MFRIWIHSFLILLKTKPAVLTKLPTINSVAGAMFRIRIHSFRIFLGLPDPDQLLFARIRILSFTLLQVLSGRENACKIKFQ
jgi:hypothetical protein